MATEVGEGDVTPRVTTAADARPRRWILHVDLDQFQVSVERLRAPELVGVPVIVGGAGDPHAPRTVVTCASYEARDVGVRAGMPLRTAHRKLPDAVYLPTDHETYDIASEEVMTVLRGLGHPVEVWGWDEAYVGADVEDPRALAATIIRRIREETGLTCAVGISDNKQRAKMATNFAKEQPPGTDRVDILTAETWMARMGDHPCRDLWSVGPKTAQKLTAMDVHSVADLVATPRETLVERFGNHQGTWLYVLARGGGDATITEEPHVARSHSKVQTFPTDVTDVDELHRRASALAADVLALVRAEGRVVSHVAVTVRTSTFFTRTKSRKLPTPTTHLTDIEPTVHTLLDRFELDRPVRLLGVRLDLVLDD
ncbi:DNA polymerase IV [Williamsia serinedens]|uniref:DNA-directed DNA polymerase n=1 Tax=Williamsia serinedens TaxID=391736 RepID=A0ABT1H8N4_9NOCA|nr:DNA polymerase IV [Williamsia serinedens]MCP2162978.1 DNA polymerase-4 [Williamsia serinedens]